MPKTRKSDKLTEKEKLFVCAYIANGFNGTAAVEMAGYHFTTDGAKRACASKMLVKSRIVAAVQSATEKMQEAIGITKDFIVEKHRALMKDALDKGDRTNAREHLVALGKTIAAYTDKQVQLVAIISAPADPESRREWLTEQQRLLDDVERAGTAIASRQLPCRVLPAGTEVNREDETFD